MNLRFPSIVFAAVAVNCVCAQTTKEYVYFGSRMLGVDASTTGVSISPTQATLPPAGGNAMLFVTANSTAWTASTTTSWIHFTGITSGSGNAGVAYSYDPLPSGTPMRSGSISVGSSTLLITQIATVPNPTNVSATATPASGADATFSFTASSQGGPKYFNWIYVIVNKTPSYTGACAFLYTAGDNRLYLDNGQGSWSGWGEVGSSGQLTSPFCQINLSEVSVVPNFGSNQLKLITKIHYSLPGMAGSQNVYMLVQDNAGNMDTALWQQMMSYVPYSIGLPSVISLSPSSGSGLSQQFTSVFSHPQGADKLGASFILFSPANTPVTPGSCFIYYNGSLFNLLDDSSSTWLIGPNWPQSNFPIPNSTCTVTSGSVSTTAFTRAVTTNVTFAPSATAKTFNVFLFDHDVYAQQTGWQFMGTWTVPGAAPPVSISIAPHSLQQMTSGSTQQFTATVTGTTNTAVSWSISPPSPQATLSSANGNTATVNVTPNQVTPELVTLKATSTANPLIFDTLHLNLQPASPVPSLLTVSSPSLNQIVGATIPQTITFTATDITASQIDWIQPLITSNYPLQDPTMFYNGQPGSNPGCHLLYYSATSLATTQSNGVWLYTDDGVTQFAWTPIGSGGGSIWNNRCLVNGQESSATTSSDGQSLQLNLKLTFYAGTSGMSGYQNVFLSAANHQYYSNNLYLGWQFKGYFLVY